jgi:hypothetical protein
MDKGKGEIRVRALDPLGDLANQSTRSNRRLITRDTLQLVKMLRSVGFRVIVEPEHGGELRYYIRKGIVPFLEDPLVLTLIGSGVTVGLTVLLELVRDWLRDQGGARSPTEESNIAIEITESETTLRFNHRGEKLDPERFDRIVSLFEKAAERRKPGPELRVVSPSPEFPVPLFLEHTDKIVGWASLTFEGERTRVRCTISDDETWDRIHSGELRGFSIAGTVRLSRCSICHGNYAACDHLTKRMYGGKECINRIEGFEGPIELSVVRNPVNPLAIIELKKK